MPNSVGDNHSGGKGNLQLRPRLVELRVLFLAKLILRLLLQNPPEDLPTDTLGHAVDEFSASTQLLIISDFAI